MLDRKQMLFLRRKMGMKMIWVMAKVLLPPNSNRAANHELRFVRAHVEFYARLTEED